MIRFRITYKQIHFIETFATSKEQAIEIAKDDCFYKFGMILRNEEINLIETI
jgi:hypothetical protein